jgi:uncharacterized iron-regulated protein
MQNGSVSDQANLILAVRERDRQQAQASALALQKALEAVNQKQVVEHQAAIALHRQEEKLKADQAEKLSIPPAPVQEPEIKPSKGISR